MLHVTDGAKQQLHEALVAANGTGDKCFRIVRKEDSRALTLHFDEPTSSDSVYSHEGDDVLALPRNLQPFLDDKSLDVDRSGRLKLC